VLRALRELVLVLVVILGLAFLAAFGYQHAGGVDAHRAYSVVFYVGGGVLLLFALLTRGAEGRWRSSRASASSAVGACGKGNGR
jgi:hypothetical protein